MLPDFRYIRRQMITRPEDCLHRRIGLETLPGCILSRGLAEIAEARVTIAAGKYFDDGQVEATAQVIPFGSGLFGQRVENDLAAF